MARIYEDGTYLDNNPGWHEQDSPWKARQIDRIIKKNSLNPKTICEIGCGAGEILNQLSAIYVDSMCFGYEISPQAFALCGPRSKVNLTFRHSDLLIDESAFFDIIMAIDVFEHVEDYFGFLRRLKKKADFKIFHIPLDISVQAVFRLDPILNRRKDVGHIHYFTKETAIETLKDTGYSVIDYFYTSSSLDLPNRGWKATLMKAPRKFAFWINEDWAVRVLGGYSLLVLAK